MERYRGEMAGAEETIPCAEEQLQRPDAELEQITTMLGGELRVMEEKQAATSALTAQRQRGRKRTERPGAGGTRGGESRSADCAGSFEHRSATGQRRRRGWRSLRRRRPAHVCLRAIRRAPQDDGRIELANVKPNSSSTPPRLSAAEMALREGQSALGADRARTLREAQRLLAEKESKARSPAATRREVAKVLMKARRPSCAGSTIQIFSSPPCSARWHNLSMWRRNSCPRWKRRSGRISRRS